MTEARHHKPVLGPAPCQGCGTLVEWTACCGWLAQASDAQHDCTPYLTDPAVCPHGSTGPHRAAGMLPRAADDHCSGPGTWYPLPQATTGAQAPLGYRP